MRRMSLYGFEKNEPMIFRPIGIELILKTSIRYGMAWHGMVWHGTVCHGMVWYGMVWYSLGALTLAA